MPERVADAIEEIARSNRRDQQEKPQIHGHPALRRPRLIRNTPAWVVAVIVLAAAVAAGWAVFWALGLSAVSERPGLSIAGRPSVRVAAAAVVGVIVGGLLAWAFRPAQTLRRTARTWGTTARRRTPRIPLFGSLTAAVVTGVVLAALATWIISGAVFTHAAGAGDVDVVKAALPPIAGAVIAVALVVVYRRQNDTERAQFGQRLSWASTQLDSDTAVRIAGVYAMAAAADESAVFGQLRIRRYPFRRDVSGNPPGGTQPAIPRCITPRPWPPYLVARESGTGSLRPAKTRTTISTAEVAWQHWSR